MTITSAWDAVLKITMFLLTSDVSTRKLVGVRREGIGETLNCLNSEGVGMVIKRNVGYCWRRKLIGEYANRIHGH